MNDDEMKYCPACAHKLGDPRSLRNEYWHAHSTVYFCWCHRCGWKGEIIKVSKVTATEPDE